MHQNAIYICISWYSKTCWFPGKKFWYQQNSRVMSRDSYIFGIFFSEGITVPSFIIVEYVWQILGSVGFLASAPIREQPQKIPSWIGLNIIYNNNNNFLNPTTLKIWKRFLIAKYSSLEGNGLVRKKLWNVS